MFLLRRFLRIAAMAVVAGLAALSSQASDVRGYSLMVGEFFIQTGSSAEEVIADPDLGVSLLASVDLTDFSLVSEASLQTPGSGVEVLDDLGDSWVFLASRDSLTTLIADYGWGDYTVQFSAANDGEFACVLSLPNSPLPPVPRFVDVDALQQVDAGQPLQVDLAFASPPGSEDFVQVYITQGHAIVFSTPDFGEPGALDGAARSVTIPSGQLGPASAYSLTLEVTRPVSTNATDYPHAVGIAATFVSTSANLYTLAPPQLRLLSPPADGACFVEAVVEPGATVVLQGSPNFASWSNLATNSEPSGTNVFAIPAGPDPAFFYRAWQP